MCETYIWVLKLGTVINLGIVNMCDQVEFSFNVKYEHGCLRKCLIAINSRQIEL
jgi:hypothetical protein